ncbi:hypothetical protein KDW_07100 [Dictyobacter vulcani]|uniref:Uncharacterized protein n=1 Tax=Dictyobacter vulcani TaxID=2607529 RepID=A0A5J4KCP5_9CHLR|nr:hypothetical protein KDW_07100 [Dictyobacter vulcani]
MKISKSPNIQADDKPNTIDILPSSGSSYTRSFFMDGGERAIKSRGMIKSGLLTETI